MAQPHVASAQSKWFLAGTIGLFLFAAAHCLAIVKQFTVAPATPQEIEFVRAAQALSEPMGPFHPTAYGAFQILNISYTLLMALAATINFVARHAMARAGVLARVAWINAGFNAALLAVSLAYQFPPPAVFAAACMVLFVIAANRPGAAPLPAA